MPDNLTFTINISAANYGIHIQFTLRALLLFTLGWFFLFSFCQGFWDSDVVILIITSIVLCLCWNSNSRTLCSNAIVFTELTLGIQIQLWWNTNYSILNWMKIEHTEWRTRHKMTATILGSFIDANRYIVFLQLHHHK